jgi:hypothetical protein
MESTLEFFHNVAADTNIRGVLHQMLPSNARYVGTAAHHYCQGD